MRLDRCGGRPSVPLLLAVLLITSCGGEQSTPPVTRFDNPAASLAEFETRVDQIRRDLNVPGLGLAIASGQRVVWSRGLGFADVENSVAPDGLTNRGNLADGDLLISPLAAEFVRAFVTGTTPLP
jgi:hypothetical protein